MTLSTFFRSKGLDLPTIPERGDLFQDYKLGSSFDYKGTFEQNVSLLSALKTDSVPFERRFKLEVPVKDIVPPVPPIKDLISKDDVKLQLSNIVEKEVKNKSIWDSLKDWGSKAIDKLITIDIPTPEEVFQDVKKKFIDSYIDPVIDKVESWVDKDLYPYVEKKRNDLKDIILNEDPGPLAEPANIAKEALADFFKSAAFLTGYPQALIGKIELSVLDQAIDLIPDGIKIKAKEVGKVIKSTAQDTIVGLVGPRGPEIIMVDNPKPEEIYIIKLEDKSFLETFDLYSQSAMAQIEKTLFPSRQLSGTRLREEISKAMDQNKKISVLREPKTPVKLELKDILEASKEYQEVELSEGITLKDIALNYGITETQLLDLNPDLKDPSKIMPGIKIKLEKDLLTKEEQEELKKDPSAIWRMLQDIQEDIKELVKRGTDLGIPWLKDEATGEIIDIDYDKWTQETLSGIAGMEENSFLKEYNEKVLRLQEISSRLGQLMLEEGKEIEDFISEPRNLTSAELKDFASKMTVRYGSLEELRNFKKAIDSYEIFLDKNKDFKEKLDEANNKIQSLSKQLEALETSDLLDYISLLRDIESLSPEQRIGLETYYNSNKARIDKYFDLLFQIRPWVEFAENNKKRIDEFNSGIIKSVTEIQERLQKFLTILSDPKVIDRLEDYARAQARPTAEFLILLKESFELGDWLEKNESEATLIANSLGEEQAKTHTKVVAFQSQLQDWLSGPGRDLSDLYAKRSNLLKLYGDSLKLEELEYWQEKGQRAREFLDLGLFKIGPLEIPTKIPSHKREFFLDYIKFKAGVNLKKLIKVWESCWNNNRALWQSLVIQDTALLGNLGIVIPMIHPPEHPEMKNWSMEDWRKAQISAMYLDISSEDLERLSKKGYGASLELFRYLRDNPVEKPSDVNPDIMNQLSGPAKTYMEIMDFIYPWFYDPILFIGTGALKNAFAIGNNLKIFKPFSKAWSLTEKIKWSKGQMDLQQFIIITGRLATGKPVNAKIVNEYAKIPTFYKWRNMFLGSTMAKNTLPPLNKLFFGTQSKMINELNEGMMQAEAASNMLKVANKYKIGVQDLEKGIKNYIINPGEPMTEATARFFKETGLKPYLIKEQFKKTPEMEKIFSIFLKSRIKKDRFTTLQLFFNKEYEKLSIKSKEVFDKLIYAESNEEFIIARSYYINIMVSKTEKVELTKALNFFERYSNVQEEALEIYRHSKIMVDIPESYGIRFVNDLKGKRLLKGKDYIQIVSKKKITFVFDPEKYYKIEKVLRDFSRELIGARWNQLADQVPIRLYSYFNSSWVRAKIQISIGQFKEVWMSIDKASSRLWKKGEEIISVPLERSVLIESSKSLQNEIKALMKKLKKPPSRNEAKLWADELKKLQINLENVNLQLQKEVLERGFTFSDVIKTEYIERFFKQLSSENQARLLRTLNPLVTREKKTWTSQIAYSADYETRLAEWMDLGTKTKAWEIEPQLMSRIVSNEVEIMIKETAGLKLFKKFNPRLFRDYSWYLKNSAPTDLSGFEKLHKEILRLDISLGGNERSVLSPFLETLLMKNEIGIELESVITRLNQIAKLDRVNHLISKANKMTAFLKGLGWDSKRIAGEIKRATPIVEVEVKREAVEAIAYNLPFSMARKKTLQLPPIIWKIIPYLPRRKATPEELKECLIRIEELAKAEATKLHLDFTQALKIEDKIAVMHDMQNVISYRKKGFVALISLPSDSVKIPQDIQLKIIDAVKSGYSFRVADVTSRDRAFIEFLKDLQKSIDFPFDIKITKPLDKITPEGLLTLLKVRHYDTFLGLGIFRDWDILNILSKVQDILLSLPATASQIQKANVAGVFNSFRSVLQKAVSRSPELKIKLRTAGFIDEVGNINKRFAEELYSSYRMVLDDFGVSYLIPLRDSTGKVTNFLLKRYSIEPALAAQELLQRSTSLFIGSRSPIVSARLVRRTDMGLAIFKKLDITKFEFNASRYPHDIIKTFNLDKFATKADFEKALKLDDEILALKENIKKIGIDLRAKENEVKKISDYLGAAKTKKEMTLLEKETKLLIVRLSEVNKSLKVLPSPQKTVSGKSLLKGKETITTELKKIQLSLKSLPPISKENFLKQYINLEKETTVLRREYDEAFRILNKKNTLITETKWKFFGTPEIFSELQRDFYKLFLKNELPSSKFFSDLDSQILTLAKRIKSYDKEVIRLSKQIKSKGDITLREKVLREINVYPYIISRVDSVKLSTLVRNYQLVIAESKETLEALQALKRCVVPWKISWKKGLRLTEVELYEISRGVYSQSYIEKARKLSKALDDEKAKLLSYKKQLGVERSAIPSEYKGTVELHPELLKAEPDETLMKMFQANFLAADYAPPGFHIFDMRKYRMSIEAQRLKLAEDISKARAKIVIDFSPQNLLDKFPLPCSKARIEVLSEGKIVNLSRIGMVSKPEKLGLEELKRLYFENEGRVILFGNDDFVRTIKEMFETRILKANEKQVIEATLDAFKRYSKMARTPSIPGSPFKFTRRKYTPEEMKILGLSESLAASLHPWSVSVPPTKALKYSGSQVLNEIALRDAEIAMRKAGFITKETEILNLSRAGVPLMVQTAELRFLPSEFYKSLNNAIKNKVKIFLPKEMNSGELIIASYLKKKGIEYFPIVVNEKFARYFITSSLAKSKPLYLLSTGKVTGWRANLLKTGLEKKRMYKSIEFIRHELVDDALKQIKAVREIPGIYVPDLISELVRKGKPLNKTLAIWMRMTREPVIRKSWMHQKELILKIQEQMWKEEGKSSKEIAELFTAHKDHLKALEDYVLFSVGKKQVFLEKIRKGLATRIKIDEAIAEGSIKYDYKTHEYQLFGLPLDKYKKRIVNGMLKEAEKLSYNVPEALKLIMSKIGLARTIWVHSVLFYRPGWYLWNFLDDVARSMIGGSTFREAQKVAKAHRIALEEYVAMGGMDTGQLFLSLFGISKKLKPFDAVRWQRTRERGMYAVMKDLMDANKVTRLSGKQGLRLGDGTKIFTDDLSFASASGLAQVESNPMQMAKMINLMPETTWVQRLTKRFMIHDADIKMFASMTEELRRLGMLHSLLFERAMSFAKAEAKVKRYLFDYRDLTWAGRKMRWLFPFYTFQVKALRLYFEEAAKEGPRAYAAALHLMDGWNKATAELPEYYRDRVALGNGIWWNPHFSLIEFLGYFREPFKTLEQFVHNPLRMFFGLGWDPFISATVQKATGKGFFDIDNNFKELGWSKWEIENWKKNEKITIKKDENWFLIWLDQVPFVPLIKALGEIDETLIMRETSMINNKNLRALSKFFGLNFIKWDTLNKLKYLYFRMPPSRRKYWVDKLKQEDPEAYKIWEDYWAIAELIKVSNLKGQEKIEAAKDLEIKYYISYYYKLEDYNPGAGRTWVEQEKKKGNLLPEAVMLVHWKGLQMTPWRLISKEQYERTTLKGIINEYLSGLDKNWTEDKFHFAEIFNIPIPYGPFSYDEIRGEFLDEEGDIKPVDLEEVKAILGKDKWENVGLPELAEETIKNAELNYLDWAALSREAKEQEREADAVYYWKWAQYHAIFPPNLNKFSSNEQNKYFTEAQRFFDKEFSEKEKIKYIQSLPEISILYRKSHTQYITDWKDIISQMEKEPSGYYDYFYEKSKAFQEYYFYQHPNKAEYYSKMQVFTNLLTEADKIYKENWERSSKPMDYFNSAEFGEKARGALEKDKPDTLAYYKAWDSLIKGTAEGTADYFELYYLPDKEFEKKFGMSGIEFRKRHTEKKSYILDLYPFLEQGGIFMKQDQENWDKKGIRTQLYHSWIFAKKNKKYLDIWEEHKPGITKYLSVWAQLFQLTEENPEDYFEVLYMEPKAFEKEFGVGQEWFLIHFFNQNPLKKIYYPFLREWIKRMEEDRKNWEEKGLRTHRASDWFWSPKNAKALAVYEKTNPGITIYMKAWQEISLLTEKNPEVYFKLFYLSDSEFKGKFGMSGDEFRKRFFKNNPEKQYYYWFLKDWVGLIKEDKEYFERTGQRSTKARNYFNRLGKDFDKARKYYEKNNEGILEYLRTWEKIMEETESDPKNYFKNFYSQTIDFRNRFFKNNPEKRLYYPFLYEFGRLIDTTGESRKAPSDYFWSSKNEKAREAYFEANPNTRSYFTFWKDLNSLAERGNWNKYWLTYWSSSNLVNREKHWKNNPEAKLRMTLNYDYFKLPSITFEDRKKKHAWLLLHPKMVQWWEEDLEPDELVLRKKLQEYFGYLYKIPSMGEGKDYFEKVLRWRTIANNYLRDNPEIQLYFDKNAPIYTGQKAIIFSLLNEYEEIEDPTERQKFLQDNSILKEYFRNSQPPGLRPILDAQEKYFKIINIEEKQKFLEDNPELELWWKMKRLPYSYFWDPLRFKPFKEALTEIENYFKDLKSARYIEAEGKRLAISKLFEEPGETDEGIWLRNVTYHQAMKTWVDLIDKNEFIAVWFFRNIPSWIRARYYNTHPWMRYLSKEPLSRFIEEPLLIWAELNPELDWAYQMWYKYGKNVPSDIESKIREIMVEFGKWEDRSSWTRYDWQEFWRKRALALNEAKARDFEAIPLLAKELEKVIRRFPLRIRPRAFFSPKIGIVHPFF